MITRKLKIDENLKETPENSGKAFPVTIHYNDLGKWVKPKVGWHWHKDLEFDVILKGRAIICTAHEENELSEGEGCYVNSEVMHQIRSASEEAPIILTHLVDPIVIAGDTQSVFEQKYITPVIRCRKIEQLPFRLEDSNQRNIIEHLRISYEAADMENDGYEFTVRNELSSAWQLMLREAGPFLSSAETRPDTSRMRVKVMMIFIQQRYREKLTLDEIAASANISRREALRDFQKCLGMTPFEYLTGCRLRCATNELMYTDKAVTEIAIDNGFPSPSYFSKMFKQKAGMAPLQYRKKAMAGSQGTVPRIYAPAGPKV